MSNIAPVAMAPMGLSKTPAASAMKVKPTNIVDHRMASMKVGEIYWVIASGIG